MHAKSERMSEDTCRKRWLRVVVDDALYALERGLHAGGPFSVRMVDIIQ